MKNTTTEEREEEKHLPAAETASHDSERERAGGYAVDGWFRGMQGTKDTLRFGREKVSL